MKEFKTQAQVEFRERGVEPTPILTTFAPSLPAGKTFQVSVHSWSRTEPVLLPAPDGTRPRELWEARVVVDGQVATVAHLPIDAQWPQIISEWSAFTRFESEITNARLQRLRRMKTVKSCRSSSPYSFRRLMLRFVTSVDGWRPMSGVGSASSCLLGCGRRITAGM